MEVEDPLPGITRYVLQTISKTSFSYDPPSTEDSLKQAIVDDFVWGSGSQSQILGLVVLDFGFGSDIDIDKNPYDRDYESHKYDEYERKKERKERRQDKIRQYGWCSAGAYDLSLWLLWDRTVFGKDDGLPWEQGGAWYISGMGRAGETTYRPKTIQEFAEKIKSWEKAQERERRLANEGPGYKDGRPVPLSERVKHEYTPLQRESSGSYFAGDGPSTPYDGCSYAYNAGGSVSISGGNVI